MLHKIKLCSKCKDSLFAISILVDFFSSKKYPFVVATVVRQYVGTHVRNQTQWNVTHMWIKKSIFQFIEFEYTQTSAINSFIGTFWFSVPFLTILSMTLWIIKWRRYIFVFIQTQNVWIRRFQFSNWPFVVSKIAIQCLSILKKSVRFLCVLQIGMSKCIYHDSAMYFGELNLHSSNHNYRLS